MVKRALDILISAAVLALLWPVFAAVAVAVWLDSGLPVFYGQTRVGKGFCRFTLWKFRSMWPNAGGPRITVAGDLRVTRVGRFLRRTKLDELPQFWNVLKGDMSLVGPRPEVPEFVEIYRERYRRVLSVRPGITDLASIRFRNEEAELAAAPDPHEQYVRKILPMKLDLADEYLERRSLACDAAILLRTAAAVLRPS